MPVPKIRSLSPQFGNCHPERSEHPAQERKRQAQNVRGITFDPVHEGRCETIDTECAGKRQWLAASRISVDLGSARATESNQRAGDFRNLLSCPGIDQAMTREQVGLLARQESPYVDDFGGRLDGMQARVCACYGNLLRQGDVATAVELLARELPQTAL